MNIKLILLLIIALNASCISKTQKDKSIKITQNNWNSFDDLLGEWTEIERDSIGYLVYKPCDGQTPSLIISNDSIILKHQIEVPSVVPIDKFSITEDSIVINTNSEILTAEFIFKIVEPNAKYILFKWNYPKYNNRGKQVIIRAELANNLRSIKNPCDSDKIPEYQFLPVEFN